LDENKEAFNSAEQQAVGKSMTTSKRTLKGAATSDKINGLRFGSRRL
jgi:hypothetical protein